MNAHVRFINTTVALAAVVLFGFAGTALAQGVDVNAEVDVSVDAEVKPLRPIELLREQRENIQQIKDEIQVRQLDAVTDVQNASSGPERRDILRGAHEDTRELRGDVREIRGTLRERLQALVKTHIGMIVRRFNAALERFDSFIARIESRTEKLQERGIDTTSVEASLSISVGLVEEAEADTGALIELIRSVADSNDAETVRAQIRAAIHEATESVKAAHRGLLSTAKMLVALVRTSPGVDSSTETEAESTVE